MQLKRFTRISIYLLVLVLSVQTSFAIKNGELAPKTPLVVPINTPTRPGFSSTCSGTLITPVKVVTAAHCMFNKAGQIPDLIRVGLPGSSNANTFENMASWKKVVQVQIAKDLNLDHISNDQGDIAILTLESPILKSPAIKLASITQIKSLINDQKDLSLFGYGVTAPGYWPDYPSKLIGKITRDIGQKEFAFVTPTGQMCDGDSGGPIYYKDGDFYFLVGVVSRSGGIGACGNFELTATYLNPYLLEFNLSLEELNQNLVNPLPTASKAPAKVKITSIKCQKSGSIKTIKGTNPKCPTGYKKII